MPYDEVTEMSDLRPGVMWFFNGLNVYGNLSTETGVALPLTLLLFTPYVSGSINSKAKLVLLICFLLLEHLISWRPENRLDWCNYPASRSSFEESSKTLTPAVGFPFLSRDEGEGL